MMRWPQQYSHQRLTLSYDYCNCWLWSGYEAWKILLFQEVHLWSYFPALSNLTPILLKAAATLEKSHSTPSTQNTDTLYLHWPFHLNRHNRHLIRRLYDDTLKPVLDYDNMQIAFSRPKNLRDLLSKSALAPTDESLVRNTLSSLINYPQQK